jgi:glycosyltransferase involved in cell wall biosynthesis
MRAADLLLLTSDFEGLPNALIEAQGLGLPAVATRCDFGPDEVVADGETGVLVPTGDPEALTAAVAALLGDPERRRRMGEAAARRARELFGLERVLPHWEALLEEAARGAR